MPDTDSFCRAISQPGTPVTAYVAGRIAVAIARPGRDFICTQDSGHEGSHKACDGQGHVLARWPRKAVEHYWQSGDCGGHVSAMAVRWLELQAEIDYRIFLLNEMRRQLEAEDGRLTPLDRLIDEATGLDKARLAEATEIIAEIKVLKAEWDALGGGRDD